MPLQKSGRLYLLDVFLVVFRIMSTHAHFLSPIFDKTEVKSSAYVSAI